MCCARSRPQLHTKTLLVCDACISILPFVAMLGHQFAFSAAPVRKVKEKAYSVAKIEHPEVMDETTHKLKLGGLMDPRMGTIDRNFKCQTCGEGMSECPGHFGHIELARPVFHPGFISKVKKILECICLHCGKLKADIVIGPPFREQDSPYPRPQTRLAVVWAHCKTKMLCKADDPKDENADLNGEEPENGHGGCGYAQPQIRKEALKLVAQYKNEKDDDDDEIKSMHPERRLLSPSDVYTTFKKMSDTDLDFLGLSGEHARPEWMVLTVLPVPPPPVRPSVTVDGGAMRSEDDLTYKLGDIVKASANVRICENEGAPPHVMTELEQLLQFHVATYMDNDLALQESGRPVKSIRARLKGKEGRLRGNLMGKRVDFSARTVITGDPNLELDEVGVPRSIAMNLTYPERVTPYNIRYVQDLVRNGPTVYPGARYVVRDTGERIDLRFNKRLDACLQYGWIVERHLKDGDFVFMMSHRTLFSYRLFSTPPYNADFDGDEMNMHEETRAELSQIAWVPRQIISPQANKPVMGIVQDTLCGIRKFTLRDTFLDWYQVQNILLWVPEWDGAVPIPAIILSLIIPRGINITRGSEDKQSKFQQGCPVHRHCTHPVNDDGMMIDNGEIIYGIVEKKIVGASQGGLIHVVFREKGPEATRQLFTGLQMVVNFWLFHNGFSIGIGDTIADKDTMSFITRKIADCKVKVFEIIEDATHDRLKAAPGMTIRESFESAVERQLNVARDESGQHAQDNLKEDNNVKQMVVAGSKGTFINISQMSICVGQQSVEGRRIPFGFRHRTLPHFTKDDFSPEARGFVENSYLCGLTPQEFYFHAMAGREGLIDTAIKTAETGYIQRRLVKALEDVMVCYDGTVRNSLGDLIQFVYGEDGMDGAFIEQQAADTFTLNNKQFEHKYRVDVTQEKGGFMSGVLQVALEDSSFELQAKLDDEYSQLVEDRRLLREFIFPRVDRNTSFYLPVNLHRIVQNATQIFHIDRRQPSDLEPVYIIDSVQALGKRLLIVRGDDPLSKDAQQDAVLRFRIHLRATFASRRVLEEYHLNREAFDWVLGEVESKFNQAIVNPGEMCGTLAAQSIGEPATQMTLNTFHFAGVSSKNVTLGIPRLKEIINVATNIKTPSLSVYLDPEISTDPFRAQLVAHKLEYTSLRAVTSAVEIWYHPDPCSTFIQEDVGFVEDFFAIPDEAIESKLHLQSPWLLRLELDRTKMVGKFTMHYSFKTDLFLIIRCRDEENMDSVEEDNTMLNSVYLVKHDKVVFESDGSINLRKREEWVLETDGTNLKTAMCVDGVDYKRTYSNSCVEIFDVLGIEAARAAILKELRSVIEFGGPYVNYRHFALLGTLMAITRHGINRADTGALMRCSFEETVEILMEAAAVGEKDDCHGVAENIMFGQMARMGTGAFEVALDNDMLNDAIPNLAAQHEGRMTPGEVAMTPYDTNYPAWQDGILKGEQASFSPLAPGWRRTSPGYVPQSPFGSTSPFYDTGATSPMYSPTSPLPRYSPTTPSFSPASPRYSPQAPSFSPIPSFSPASPRYSPSRCFLLFFISALTN
ncbi:beta and beta-prime subunits of DNA dependent RNA-polymerase [Mycena crocata]|nr:beta and beta-prime subunits of DNA dependent RNA-polymerase [Mycena crocata]